MDCKSQNRFQPDLKDWCWEDTTILCLCHIKKKVLSPTNGFSTFKEMDRLLGLLKIFAKEYGNWNKWSSWKCHENSLRPCSTPRSYIAGQGCNFKANLILKWKNDVSADRQLKRLPRPWSLNPQPTTTCNLQDSPEQRTTATRACPLRGMSSRSSQRSYLVDKTLAELDFVQALTMLSKETNSPPPCPERSCEAGRGSK